VQAGADPQRILLLTFSRRAAQEMQRRVGLTLHQVLGLHTSSSPPSLPWAGTFHGIGARLLREFAGQIGLAENFSIHDRGDSEDLMGLMRQEQGLPDSKNRFPLKGTCLSIYSRVINSQAPLDDVLRDVFPWCAAWSLELKKLFSAYVIAKQSQQILDYDDLLLYWSYAMAEANLAAHLGARFDHVLVDEYQDTNRLQSAILRAMKPNGFGLTVVGDDAQSIYSFRAAEVRNILDFPTEFTPNARVVTLDQNYRSTQPILSASNEMIALAGEGYSKRLWTDRIAGAKPALVTVADDAAQAKWVADQVLEHREAGLPLKSQAVLFRTSHHSATVELELTRRNIPFVKFGGLKFLDSAHVKDLLAVLRWAENSRNRLAGFRVAQLLPGVGPNTARRLLDTLQDSADPIQALADFKPPAAAQADWQGFFELFESLRGHTVSEWPAELDQIVAWYAPYLAQRHDDAPMRLADLNQLCRIGGSYASRERFLTELTLDLPDASSDQSGPPHRDEDYLILSTIHSAKGQEWRAVYVLNVVDGCIPSDLSTGSGAQIDEERRLLYVAMTRAKEHLQLIAPQRFYVTQQNGLGDRHVYGSLSRFLPASIHTHFEARSPTAPTAVGREACAALQSKIDVSARARALWNS
jgi:DNA helicase II / ATP-dependent DNA helicase PcrA